MNELNESKRKFIKKSDVIFIIALVLLSAVLFLLLNSRKGGELVAVISYDGEKVMEINLQTAQDEVFTLEQNPKVSFEIKDGKIAFVNVDCPDKLCEKSGFLSRPNETSICLPNKTTLTIKSNGNEEIDIMVD